jgi:hypothetical protein
MKSLQHLVCGLFYLYGQHYPFEIFNNLVFLKVAKQVKVVSINSLIYCFIPDAILDMNWSKLIRNKGTLFVMLLFATLSLFAQESGKFAGIEVYYFHGKHRCATCNAVEKVTQEALKQYYGNQITLKAIDREEAQNSELVKKYQVAGQALLIVKGNQKFDLTNVAFMNAERSPYRLKNKIKETIDKL